MCCEMIKVKKGSILGPFLGGTWKLETEPYGLGILGIQSFECCELCFEVLRENKLQLYSILLMDSYMETLYQITWVLNCFFSFLINFLFGPQKLLRPIFKLRATPLTWSQPLRTRRRFVWLFLTVTLFGFSHWNRVSSRTAKWLQWWHRQPLLALEAQNPYIKFPEFRICKIFEWVESESKQSKNLRG